MREKREKDPRAGNGNDRLYWLPAFFALLEIELLAY
jgi:hypothetical protein